MENERQIYTEKDFPIRGKISFVAIPTLIVFIFLFLQMMNESGSSTLLEYVGTNLPSVILIFGFCLVFGIFAWKKRGFIVDDEGVKCNPYFIDESKALFGEIDRVFVEQDFFGLIFGFASVCVVRKVTTSLFGQTVPEQKRTIRIRGLSPQDARSLQSIIQSRLAQLTVEEVARAGKEVILKTDGQSWFAAILVSIVIPLFLSGFIIGTPGKIILFFLIHPFLVWWSFVQWKRLLGTLTFPPQVTFLLVVFLADTAVTLVLLFLP